MKGDSEMARMTETPGKGFAEACEFMAEYGFEFSSHNVARLLGYGSVAYERELWTKLAAAARSSGAKTARHSSVFMETVCDVVDPSSQMSPDDVLDRVRELVKRDRACVQESAEREGELIGRRREPGATSDGTRDGVLVREMVAEWLRDHGYQGLVRDDLECGCGLGDLMPCGVCDAAGCAAAHEFRCRECASSDRCDKGNGDFVYSTDESWCEDFEGRSAS